MPARTRNQNKQGGPTSNNGHSDRHHHGRRNDDEEWEQLDDQQVERLLHDDDEDEEDNAEEEEEEQEEEEDEKDKKKKKKNSKAQANGQQNSQEDSNDESPTKNKNNNQYEIDPLTHLVEQIVYDKKFDGVRKYYIKLKGLSYHYNEWKTEDEINKLSYQCQQKLKRYKIKKEKNGGIVLAPNLEEGHFFDKNYLEVDKVLSCTNLFPVIHPHTSKKINDTWRERAIDILQLIVNFRKDNHCYAIPFLFLRGDDSNCMDFTTINNRLFTISNPPPQNNMQQQTLGNRGTQNQNQNQNQAYNIASFWQDLGQVFKENLKIYQRGTKQRVFLEYLRELSYHLYNAWHDLVQVGEPYVASNENNEKTILQDLQTQISKYKENSDKQSKNDITFQQSVYNYKNQINGNVSKFRDLLNKTTGSSDKPVDINELQDKNKLIANINSYLTGSDDKLYEEILKLISTLLANMKQDNTVRLKQAEEAFKGKEKDYSWLLDKDETLDEVTFNQYINPVDAQNMLQNIKKMIDPLLLVKWKNLSYCDSTWEPYSKIKDYEDKIRDFERFNRSLDNNQRQKMSGFSYANKQLIKIFEKKLQVGKKIDSKSTEESQTRDLINKLLKTEIKLISSGYFQYDYEKNLVPQFKKGQTLKDYQISGLNWLLRAWQDNRNVVLADEMGLGKTIMTIGFLDHMMKIWKIRGPFIVIAPLSTLDHWKRVAEDWTQMNVVVYHDPRGQEGRNEIQKWESYYTDITNKGTLSQKSKICKFNLMITSYEVFNQDLMESLQEIPFLYVVVDEAHRLKNKHTKTLQLLKQHPCRKILLLTGTPIQNNTKELFTILNYIEPDTFNSFDKFMGEYGKLETAEQIEKLHTMLRPHFLRRMKDEVEFSIPPLKETVIEVGLTSIQQTYYKGIYGENMSVLASMGSNSVKTSQFNNIDIQLRKCCNHLFLLKGVEEELTRDCHTDAEFLQKILDSSGKMILLDKFIEKYRQENHKMLVFSQFKGMIDIVEHYLKLRNIRYEILTGSVKSSDRGLSISRFNDDNEFGVFLLTTRAGGLGINLTRARVVVIFDSDWNPQNDLQAIARAHRIGQQFEVSVYRFITSKTYEQQMFERASRKLGMEQALFQKGAFGDKDGDPLAQELKINPKEIENLLKYGAYAFLDDGSGENIQNTHIDDILAKNTSKQREYKMTKGIYTLQKSQFNVDGHDHHKHHGGRSSAQKKNLPNVSDPNFWEKVLPFEGYNPKQLMRKFKQKKADILKNKESQSKYIKEINKCIKDLLEAKSMNDSITIDEEMFDLLKKIQKTKQFENKYRDKAGLLLNKIIHFNDYQNAIIRDDNFDQTNLQNGQIDPSLLGKRTLKRTAKENIDYKSNKKRDIKEKSKKEANTLNTEELTSEQSSQEDGGRKRFNRLCKDKKQKEEDYNQDDAEMEDEQDHDQDDDEEMKLEDGSIQPGDLEDEPKNKKKAGKGDSQSDKYSSKNYCAVCEQVDPPIDIKCSKYCKRCVHFKCIKSVDAANLKALKEGNMAWQCSDCEQSVGECFECKQLGKIYEKSPTVKVEKANSENKMKPLVKCSISSCCKYYHESCLKQSITNLKNVKQKSLKCLLHYCQKCQLQGEKMVECIRCPKAIHKKCFNESKNCLKRLSKRFMICRKHEKSSKNKSKAKHKNDGGAGEQKIVINLKSNNEKEVKQSTSDGTQ